jgi:hypothetical protein
LNIARRAVDCWNVCSQASNFTADREWWGNVKYTFQKVERTCRTDTYETMADWTNWSEPIGFSRRGRGCGCSRKPSDNVIRQTSGRLQSW